MKSKGFTLVELLGVIALLAVIGLIVYPNVIKIINQNKEKLYNNQVKSFIKGAQNYVIENDDGSGKDMSIMLTSLKDFGYISSKYLLDPRDNSSITDYCISIKYNNSINQYEYNYVNSGDCPSLANKIKSQYNENNTVGLIKESDNSGYYYKGTNEEVTNNWVWWAGILWRVMSIDNDNNITMISSGPIVSISPTQSVGTDSDLYNTAYINTWLNSEGIDGVLYKSLTSDDKNKIVLSNYNIDSSINESPFGLLDSNTYLSAGVTSGTDSYLDIKDNFWLSNTKKSLHNSYIIDTGVRTYINQASYSFGVRPVVKIKNIEVISGDNSLGTISNPYREANVNTNTSNIKVGEYISVPYTSNTKYCNSTTRCTFRVVSIDDNSVKVTLNGLLSETVAFGSTSTYTKNNTVDTYLKGFYNSISDNYKYTGNDKIFGIGQYVASVGLGINYNVVKTPTITQNYGLPVIGELFTGNDIDMTTTVNSKSFVVENTIENSTKSFRFTTMNAADDTNVYGVDYSSSLYINNITYTYYGVRPVIFLKKGKTSDLIFTSGDGTAEHPYMLGN